MAMDDLTDNMGGMDDAAREQFDKLQRQEEDGTISDDGMTKLQELRDRFGNQ